MSRTVFLTGGTGLIGSHLGHCLLKSGDKVIYLVRPTKNAEAKERIQYPLSLIDPNFDLDQYPYEILVGDIRAPKLGIENGIITHLQDKVDAIFHAAGSISFSKAESENTWQTNVEGARRTLEFAECVGSGYFGYVSTAYVVGNDEGLAHEEIASPEKYNNYYELTKAIAETLVIDSGIPFSIFRPPIVMGDSKTGRTLKFDGYYMYLRSFWLLRKSIMNRLQKNPDYYKDIGIRINDETGNLVLPLLVKYHFDATINLMFADAVAEMIVKLSKKELSRGKIFHLTHPHPPTVKWALLTSLKLIGVEGVQLVNPDIPDVEMQHNSPVLDRYQKVLNEGLAEYNDYTTLRHSFDTFNVRAILNSNYYEPPLIDEKFLKKTVNYVIEKNFRDSHERMRAQNTKAY